MEYIDKGGIIVYILIFLNIIGFTIIIWKFLTIPRKKAMVEKIKRKVNEENLKTIEVQIEYEVKRLESGLTYIKNIASIAGQISKLEGWDKPIENKKTENKLEITIKKASDRNE